MDGEEGPEDEEECGEAKDWHNQVQEQLEQIHGLWTKKLKKMIIQSRNMCLDQAKQQALMQYIGLVCMSD